jgi:3-ketosteroid 9alpha-monooxygenase subunit B
MSNSEQMVPKRLTRISGVLDGKAFEYEDWEEGAVLLDFLLSKGLKPPHSCRLGDCGACAYRVVAGDVQMVKNEALDPDDVADGIRLACQSTANCAHVEVSFDG